MEVADSAAPNMDMMSQFMDVITTFKCKGCDFVCYKQEDLFEHVKSEHLPQPATASSSDTVMEPEDQTGEINVDEDDVAVTDASTTSLIASLVNEAENSGAISGSYIAGTNIQTVNIQRYVDGHPTDQVVFLDSGEDRSDLFNSKDSTIQPEETFLCGHCRIGFQEIDECKKHMVEEHKVDLEDLSATQASIDIDDGVLNATTQTADILESNVNEQMAEEMDSATTSNKLVISEREERSDGKISMSTQVVRKKVGRKSKAELLELAKKENRKPIKDSADYDEVITVSTGIVEPMDSEDEEDEAGDIEDGDTGDTIITYVEIEIPGKRKRRAPKHLTDDYLVPKKTRYMTDSWSDGIRDYKSSRNTRHFSSRKSGGHLKMRTAEYPFKCDQCRARFILEDNLLYHNLTHSKEVDPVDPDGQTYFVCPEEQCKDQSKFKTPMWADFKQHAWKDHSIDLGMLACDQCDYKATVRSKLVIHKQIHSTDKPFVCDICHKGFKQQAQLKNHALIHVAGVDVKEKESMSGRHWFVQAECDICKRTFANQKSLQCHVEAVHDKVKPFACNFCGHKAARKAMMQLHMRTHTGEKPFKCDLCDYTTGDHNSMRRHRMRHTGDKPYQCPHCTYACIQAVSLKLHLKSKHPGSDKCYSCFKCPYRSVNKTLYTNHLRDHEMGLIDESVLVPSTDYSQGTPEVPVGFSIKLGAIRDLTNGSSNTTQLICSALNAIAPSLTDDGEPLPENIETTVETILDQGGLKSHKISFQIPATTTKNAKTAEVVVQEQVAPTIPEMDALQTATMESQIPIDTLETDEENTDRTDIVQLQDQNTNVQQLQQHQNITNVPTLQSDNTSSIQLEGSAELPSQHMVELTNVNVEVGT